jgi:hypothetical protein
LARQLSLATRRELKDAMRQRYRAATERRERRQIPGEFFRVTGYHRKQALRVLNHSSTSPEPRQRERLCDEAVHQALMMLWEAADRICGKRLRVLIPVLLEAMERHGHLQLDPGGEKPAARNQCRNHRSSAAPATRSDRTSARPPLGAWVRRSGRAYRCGPLPTGGGPRYIDTLPVSPWLSEFRATLVSF